MATELSRGAALRMLIEVALIDALRLPLEHADRRFFDSGVLDRLSQVRDHAIATVELIREHGNPDAGADRDELLRSFLSLTTSLGQFETALLGAFSAFLVDDQPQALRIG